MFTTETIPSNTCTIEYTGTNYPPDKEDGILDWNAAVAKAVMPIGLIKMVSSKCSRAHDELQAQSVLIRPSFVSTRLEVPTKKDAKKRLMPLMVFHLTINVQHSHSQVQGKLGWAGLMNSISRNQTRVG